MKKQNLLYSGKAKSLYHSDDPNFMIMDFRDDMSAFDGVKVTQMAGKGEFNNKFNAFIMQKLHNSGIPIHFERLFSATESVVKRLAMIPVESVVRNIAAGHLCSRLGVEEGIDLTPPTFEFFLKNDALHDPMINDSLIHTFGWATDAEVARMKELSFAVNDCLKPLFLTADLLLVDYKLEFGRFQGQLYLGDEFTPDGCRIWDKATRKKLDKDRFRRDLGDVLPAYHEVAQRLGITL